MGPPKFDGTKSFDSWIVGQQIGRYNIGPPIGSGGMSSVYKATTPDSQQVVFKFLRPTGSKVTDLENRERFKREADALRRIQHPNVVQFLETGEHDEIPYIVMPFLDGWNLAEVLQMQRALPWAKALYVGYELGRGLAAIHSHDIIHRDIKPENIMIVKGGGIQIVDLGIARHGDAQITAKGQLVATLAYSSPEHIQGGELSERSDLFAVGALMYYMVTGVHPFAGATAATTIYQVMSKHPDPPVDIQPEVPRPVSKLIMELLEKNPDRRPQSAAQLAARCLDLRKVEGYGEATRLDLFLSDAVKLAKAAFQGKYPFVLVRYDVISGKSAGPANSFAPIIAAPKADIPDDVEKFSLGRHDDNLIVIPVKTISRCHCWILGSNERGGFFIRDNDSTNGTFVNNERADSAVRLKNGDIITFGPEPSYVFYHGAALKELETTLLGRPTT